MIADEPAATACTLRGAADSSYDVTVTIRLRGVRRLSQMATFRAARSAVEALTSAPSRGRAA
jgi:hypothetical protein